MPASRYAASIPDAAVQAAAAAEGVSPQALQDALAEGTAVIVASHSRRGIVRPCVVGAGVRTKVNANIGTSAVSSDFESELVKLDAAIAAGTDVVMDLSTGPGSERVRAAVLERSAVAVGSVPIYEAAVHAAGNGGIVSMTSDAMIEAVRRHAREGVDFQTIHASLTKAQADAPHVAARTTGIVSRGGALLACWMRDNDAENPYYERFDEVLEICREHGVVLSLGDALRPGCLADAGDEAQMGELDVIAELVDRAREAGVGVIVEGPGHVPLADIETQVRTIKSVCKGAPLYVLGPLVVDVAPGYDHITSAIGGAVAASAGADFLCYVTRAEHVCLPKADDVFEGVVASRIAAHAGDLAKGLPGARDWDDSMARARKALDWLGQFRLSMDAERPQAMRASSGLAEDEECSMCGPYCAMRVSDGAAT
ncbi:MAG: phosphomethylpyrimidine synthase ThiC [Coriobacteriales bacterium]|nr:phosphomethylpyrimidine synthase ThiC [Coriobacteriales bacterium]